MRLARVLPVLIAALSLSFTMAACGGDDDDDDDDNTPDAATTTPDASTTTPDAADTTPDAPSGGVNDLGTPCTLPTGPECEAGDQCIYLGIGSETLGYCSPNCGNGTDQGDNSLCAAGYTGPAGSQLLCAIGPTAEDPPDACAIVCTAPAPCPTGADCIEIQAGVSVCVPPAK